MLKISIILVVIMILATSWLSIRKENYVEEHSYGDVTLLIESSKRIHPPGSSMPIKVLVRNNTDERLIFGTKDSPLKSNPSVTTLGLEEPRPVYDLVIRKGVWHKPEGFWLWSQQPNTIIPSEIVLQPRETKVVVDAVWLPEKPYLFADVFIRFADSEFVTRLGVEQPKR